MIAELLAPALLALLLTSCGTAPIHRAAAGVSAQAVRPAAQHLHRRVSAPYAQQLRVERRVLGYTSYISVGTGARREIALTFDDGPGPYTARVLAILRRFGVKATFFEIGLQARAYPGLTRRLARAGMTIGDHTEEHPPLALLSRSQQALQIDGAAAAIAAAGAPRPFLFRPPYGSFNAVTLALLRARHMLMVLWTVDTSDYTRPGVKRIIYAAVSGARPGAIILFHDGGGNRSQTVAALPRIITRLRHLGYELVSVPQLLHDDPPPSSQPPPVSLAGD